MKCSKCGCELHEDHLFCHKCGSKVENLKDETSFSEVSALVEPSNNDNKVVVSQDVSSDVSKENNKGANPPHQISKIIRDLFLVLFVVGLCFKGIAAYLNSQTKPFIEQYAKENINSENNSTKNNAITSVQKEFERMANEYDKDLPEDLGYGMTMISCKMEDKSMVYTCEWKGMKPDDFNEKNIEELKSNTAEGLREDKDPYVIGMFNRMQDYNYNVTYRYINEKGERLCEFNIFPNEVL